MKLQIDRDMLYQGLSRVQGIIERRTTMPLLGYCLLEATTDALNISATDLLVSFSARYPALVEEPGSLTLPAVSFFNIIRELPASLIHLERIDPAGLAIGIGKARYQLLGLPADQFPPLPPWGDQDGVELESGLLREMIDKIIFSVSTDELQPHLTGVHWEKVSEDDILKLRMVSSDGHRLSLVDRPVPGLAALDFERHLLIPRKGISEIHKLIADEPACQLGLVQNNLILQLAQKLLRVQLLDKKFPDYRRIIPGQPRLTVTLNRQEFYEVLKRLSSLSSERFKGVRLTFSPDQLDVHYYNPDVGEGREHLPISIHRHTITEADGDPETIELPLEVGYNARYLMEPLTAMTSDVVHLDILTPRKPLVLRADADPSYLCIVMPMDLGE